MLEASGHFTAERKRGCTTRFYPIWVTQDELKVSSGALKPSHESPGKLPGDSGKNARRPRAKRPPNLLEEISQEEPSLHAGARFASPDGSARASVVSSIEAAELVGTPEIAARAPSLLAAISRRPASVADPGLARQTAIKDAALLRMRTAGISNEKIETLLDGYLARDARAVAFFEKWAANPDAGNSPL
jgi:hypothetical protein